MCETWVARKLCFLLRNLLRSPHARTLPAGAILLGLGVASPFIVRNVQDEALKEMNVIPVDQGHWGTKRYQNWVTPYIHRE